MTAEQVEEAIVGFLADGGLTMPPQIISVESVLQSTGEGGNLIFYNEIVALSQYIQQVYDLLGDIDFQSDMAARVGANIVVTKPTLMPPSTIPAPAPPKAPPGQAQVYSTDWVFDIEDDTFDASRYATAIAEYLGDPYTASDITVTMVNNSGVLTVSVQVDSGDDASRAQAATDRLNGLTPEELCALLDCQPGPVHSIKSATMSMSTVPSADGDGTSADTSLGAAMSVDDSSSAITMNEEEAPVAVIVVLVILFLLCCLLPMLMYIYARNRFGAGNAQKWMRYKLAHSNPTVPIMYLPRDVREALRADLYSNVVNPSITGKKMHREDDDDEIPAFVPAPERI